MRTLTNAVSRDRVHHAYLFVGSRGTGKTSMAKILAACLNCENGPTVEPCGVCESCVAIARATSLDVIEMDAASNNSVDDIRDLRERVAYAPVSGKHKVYILDEAHMLSPQAWNAFLKTLEEPPPRTIFVLATTEAQKVLPTVVDRCHRFDFGRPTVEQVARVISRAATAEQIQIEPTAIATIARHAAGSFRDALGTLEQLLTYAGTDPITTADVLAVLGVADAEQLFDAVDAIVDGNGAAAMRAAARLSASGRDPGQVLRDLETHGRELLAVEVLGEVPEELRMTPERDTRLAAQADALAQTDVVRLLDLVSTALEATANGGSARIQLELVLVKAAAPEVDPSTAALLGRIERLEAALARGGEPRAAGGHRPQAPAATHPAATPEPEPAQPTPEPGLAQPAPEPAPNPDPAPDLEPGPPAAAFGTGEPQLETVTACWPAVIEIVREDNEMLAALLTGARPVALVGHDVTIAFPSDSAFLKRKAEQDEYRRATAEALRSVVGSALALRYELADPDPDPDPGPDAAAGAGVSGDELVRRFMDEFDAQVLDDDPQDG